MYYIIEAMPINSKQRSAYFTRRKGTFWLSPVLMDAYKYRDKAQAERELELLKKEKDRHQKTFRILTMAPRTKVLASRR